MPYVIEVDGMATISEQLTKLEERARGVAARGLYEGAKVMADAMNKGAEGIRTEPFKGKRASRMPSPEEKKIITDAKAGIAKFGKEGADVDTSIGFRNAGYAFLGGKKVPIPKIVNAINSGTSFMPKQPFIRKAANGAKAAASKAIEERITKDFEEITGGNNT